ncbi:hypothetical protein [Corynebacterium heidelbergense]|uniref:hypothetical protein n=1 Tax=Corynebacterium heidelbergense TaxID=2055947 RepID=UPI00235900AB|nr:hypothetical protein [Corynebacterium heidelbergense]
MHNTSSYSAGNGSRTVHAQFAVPADLAPGTYVFEFGTYKYVASLETMVPLDGTAFKVVDSNPPQLSDRIKPAPEPTPTPAPPPRRQRGKLGK